MLLLVVIGVSYRLSVGELINTTSLYQQSILTELNTKVDIQMRSIEDISLAVARKGDYYFRLHDISNLSRSFSNLALSSPLIYSADLYIKDPPSPDPQESIHYISINELNKVSWYPKVVNSDSAWISEHVIGTSQDELPVISFARKLYSPSGEVEGLLLLNVKSIDIENLLQGEGKFSDRMLLDSDGNLFSYIGDPLEQKKAKDYLTVIHSVSAKGEDVNHAGFTRYDNQFIVWSKLAHSNLMLIEVTPWSRLTKGSFRMEMILTAIGLILIVCSIFFTLGLTRQFTKPIKLLANNMSRFPKGLQADHLPDDYQNEFGALFIGYRQMTNRIEELYASLEKQYCRQREAEIKALQAMINPHFLYNTLDQLNWMAIEAGEDRMSRVLELMGKMFRIGLSNGESLITVGEELAHLEAYLEIQQIRIGEGLLFLIEVPDELRDFYIPKLTLQPFVENSIIHGFHGCNSGILEICACVDEEDLVFTIRDNGVGMRADWESNSSRTKGGYGIRNVRERLKAYFGASYEIDIKNGEDKGTIVSFRLPKLKDKLDFGGFQNVENRDN